MRKQILSIFLISCFLTISVFAQEKEMDLAKIQLPANPNIVTGVLPNGLTYYIRHNEEPKERASFYIIRNVGATLENDDQNGLAHFLEHMSFNGTKNFPGNEIVSTLQRHGIQFGANLNAYTSFDETVYNISNAPIKSEGLIDTCLLILHDWSHYVSLKEDDIDKERGVISEEWRTGRTANRRLQNQWLPVVTKGSMYAVRDIIGDLNVIKTFKPETIRNFYNAWYRTDLEAIAIVGDFDVAEMEQKVKDLFSKIPAIENPLPRKNMEIPSHDEVYFCLATDKEATSTDIMIFNTNLDTPKDQKNTIKSQRDGLVANLYNRMTSNRIKELMEKGIPPFVYGQIGIEGFIRNYYSYSLYTSAKPNEEETALEAILTENERIRRYGFMPGELERAKNDLLASLENQYNNREKISNDKYAQKISNNYLDGSSLIDIDIEYQLAQTLLPTIAIEEVSAKIKEWDSGKNRTIVITGPNDQKHLTEAEVKAIYEKVNKSTIEPYKDEIQNVSLVNDSLLKGSPIINTKILPTFNAVEWTLANGAKVVFSKIDYEKDDVSLNSFSKGGSSLYDIDMLYSAGIYNEYASCYGVGDFDPSTLRKLLSGKVAGANASIGQMTESISGHSTPKDFETMMQLAYLTFEKPRFDQQLHDAYTARIMGYLTNIEKNPQKAINDSLNRILSNYSERALLFNYEYMSHVSMDKIEKIYRDRIQDASDFTFFIVGNIEETTVKPLVEKYIGSLSSTNRKETWRDNKVRFPKGKTEKQIPIKFETPKSTVNTFFNKNAKFNAKNLLYNRILRDILNQRYVVSIREKEGGTYGVSVRSSENQYPVGNYQIQMSFDCDPQKADHLKSIIYKEIDDIIANKPTQEELDKAIKNIRKNREQSKMHNNFRMNTLYDYYWTGIDFSNSENYEQILDQTSPENIQKWAKTLFNKANVVDVIFRPE